jgi:hypothetical protein
MRKRLIFILMMTMPIMAFAQFKTQAKNQSFTDRLISSSGLSFLGFDPSRFSMSQSYSMSYATIGGQGFSQGLYLNTLRYQFAIPLTVSLQVGLAHQPFAISGVSPMMNDGIFVSGAQLRYQPTKNTVIQLDFRQAPYSGYSRYSMFQPGFDFTE